MSTFVQKQELRKLFHDYWDWRMKITPEFATSVGVHAYDNKLDDCSLQAINRNITSAKEFLKKLNGMNVSVLPKTDKHAFLRLQEDLQTVVDGFKWRQHSTFNAVNFLETISLKFSLSLLDDMVFVSMDDFELYLQRLEAIPDLIDQHIILLKHAASEETTNFKTSVSPVVAEIQEVISSPSCDSIFYKPFKDYLQLVKGASDDDKMQLISDGDSVIKRMVYPALKKLKTYLENDYIPKTRRRCGVSCLKDGTEFYKDCLRWNLSIDMDAREVHNLGLSEVRRIRENMERIKEKAHFEGTLTEFMKFLKTDKQFYHSTTNDILEELNEMIYDRIMPNVTKIFESCPDQPVEVREMPFSGRNGKYKPPTEDGSRPAIFFVNCSKPETVPRFSLMALVLHETVPGHHFQHCSAMQATFPMFIKHVDYRNIHSTPFLFPCYTAYIEGWALYSESLGEELGLFNTPHELFGKYNSEILRACGLVVDTGLHLYDWSREKGIEYLRENTCLSEEDLESEIDRYLTWPSLACAYKVGELKFKELRMLATRELGQRFNIKAFHQVVLSTGPVPLWMLEQEVKDWIKSCKNLPH